MGRSSILKFKHPLEAEICSPVCFPQGAEQPVEMVLDDFPGSGELVGIGEQELAFDLHRGIPDLMLEPEAALFGEVVNLSARRPLFFWLLQSGVRPFASEDHIHPVDVSPVDIISGVEKEAYEGIFLVGPKYGTITEGNRGRFQTAALYPRARRVGKGRKTGIDQGSPVGRRWRGLEKGKARKGASRLQIAVFCLTASGCDSTFTHNGGSCFGGFRLFYLSFGANRLGDCLRPGQLLTASGLAFYFITSRIKFS